MRDATDDWRRFDPTSIPTKESTPWLDRFLAAAAEGCTGAGGGPLRILDVGCGTGRLAVRLADAGFAVRGVDVNPEAVRSAEAWAAVGDHAGRQVRFRVADFATNDAPDVDGGPFDVVVCQLVLSIVGDAVRRGRLLRHLRAALRPGGMLYLSASGVSDAINPGYARLYAEDLPFTGEWHSYLSRDDRGEVLYVTHHFTAGEIEELLAGAGFDRIHVDTVAEASSRRPSEAAYFHYVTCRSR